MKTSPKVLADLSRIVSHALRHEPWLYELEVDEEGWVPIPELIRAISKSSKDWDGLSSSDLVQMIDASPKKRHEIDGAKIRALYGHSFPGRLLKEETMPPAKLFHGTSSQAAEAIFRDGLQPMGRQFVHLSVDRATAKEVGKRKASSPVIIEIDAALAANEGVTFYRGNDHVWLADTIPPQYLKAE